MINQVVYQFVKNLFDKWEANKANHDLQIIFFTRLFFEINKYPEYKEEVIQVRLLSYLYHLE